MALAEWFAIRAGIPVGGRPASWRSSATIRTGRSPPRCAAAREEALLAERRPAARVRGLLREPARPRPPPGRIALALRPARPTASTREANAPDPDRPGARTRSAANWKAASSKRFPGLLERGRSSLPDGAAALQGELGRRHPGRGLGRQRIMRPWCKARMGLFQGKKKAEKAFARGAGGLAQRTRPTSSPARSTCAARSKLCRGRPADGAGAARPGACSSTATSGGPSAG